ncbi:phosphotransferase [Paenibacillus provencensis]|uniref:Phosphotransferase n=1 Tax=Paenibacillus provencensis TaxID=441151 RepID=A0ABW3Q1I0_9BACL|nr:phosphotransferase [Paenibacillus sp. MER 78]MCM3129447.1 aminoglycoside phosphotransferase family protein [Paenibacillus sp. MER 78]
MQRSINIHNDTVLPIEDKLEQLHMCLIRSYANEQIEIASVRCEEFGYKTPNFTTGGIYHLHGSAMINHTVHAWSLVLKVIQQASSEKDNPQHHNYWRREALIYEAELLSSLPDEIYAPKGYFVEEQKDGTIWIWMEYLEGTPPSSQAQFEYVARLLGRFNAAYLAGSRELPDQSWLCRSWLGSWTTASRQYAPAPDTYRQYIQTARQKQIWTWFQKLTDHLDYHLDSLKRLPRVLAHQDLSPMNMFLTDHHLSLIDWQFMSISGTGEDLGKMFGVSMSLGAIPVKEYRVYREFLFDAYLGGMRDVDWQGDERWARYGYCLSTSLRSLWEVPQYFSLIARQKSGLDSETYQRIFQLGEIITIHMEMASEAESLRGYIP